tara:strand:+ start:306 stop:2564 length:2259 start_codon:yes stop_codon:yes gene_type:complete
MPTYGKENFKESNVNYLNKDFTALKQSLMNYAKSYFPDTYRDFNETSPGMMLLEMNAYVGDVLSFYIDQQYREMLLPLAEERRNIITMAKMFGYKVKPIVPAYVDLTFTSNVSVLSGNVSKVDYNNASVFDPGISIVSSTNSNTTFVTLEPIDFKIEQDDDNNTIGTTADTGLASTFTLSRTVKAVSATEKTITFQVGVPEKFKTLTIPDKNVVDIISCVDSNNNNWYEVDFLAQDKVPIQTHYTDDINRDSAYVDNQDGLLSSTAVPYSLTYAITPKRFTRETNQDNTTSLVFGNGVLKDGQVVDEGFIDLEQVGIIIPGQTNDLNQAIDPLLGNEYSTLGETPNNTTLTITYRVGGGINSNVSVGDLTTLPTTITPAADGGSVITTVTNNIAARGGKDEEDTIEIKEKAKAFFSTQNRCVTKEDYEARVLNIPAKFGNIAKVYVTRNVEGDTSSNEEFQQSLQTLNNSISSFGTLINSFQYQMGDGLPSDEEKLEAAISFATNHFPNIQNIILNNYSSVVSDYNPTIFHLSAINIYALGYNNSKHLVGNPHSVSLETTDNLPVTLTANIKNYLENFKIMTDTITINDGYIVNFGVFFDIIAEKYANKQQVKLDCIQRIKDYFRIEKMQFNQPIYKSQLEFELMGVEGVRSIGHITITQDNDYFIPNNAGENIVPPTYSYLFSAEGDGVDLDGENGIDGGFITNDTTNYNFKYDFKTALSDDGTIIVPPNTSTPTVFELKNPNQNIQGRVR